MAAEAAAKVMAEAEAAAAAAKVEAAQAAAKVVAEAAAAAAAAKAEAAQAAAKMVAEAEAAAAEAAKTKAAATAPAAEGNPLLRHLWALMTAQRKAHNQIFAQLDSLQNSHQSFAEEQRRAVIELKAVVRSGPDNDRGGRSSHADLPRRPLQTRVELEKLCSDLQRMPAFRKSMVSLR